jgi:hypothetical protein
MLFFFTDINIMGVIGGTLIEHPLRRTLLRQCQHQQSPALYCVFY